MTMRLHTKAKRLIRRPCYKFSLIFLLITFLFWFVIGYLNTFQDEDFPEDVVYDIFIDETKEDHVPIPLHQEMLEELARKKRGRSTSGRPLEDPQFPIILWWTEFTLQPGKTRSCGDKKCFFTNNRQYRHHKNMKVFVFYGTDFSPKDLPLPRSANHEWALLHEESPKNNFLLCHEQILSLFNHTSTFRRESDLPLTTQHLFSLDWLESLQYMQKTSEKNRFQSQEGLSPIIFVQSDCDPPSDRDSYVKQLSKHIKIDSYGECLNNKKLPQNLRNPLEGMSHQDFYRLISKYKFALAMENALCPDYITEKLWRPLMTGVVPIILGSPTVKDFLPSNNSAIVISDFPSPKALADFINHLDSNDRKYDSYLSWKSTGVTNGFLQDVMASRHWEPDVEDSWTPQHVNFVDAFECLLCERAHETWALPETDGNIHFVANAQHYGCSKPLQFDSKGIYREERHWRDFWRQQWERDEEEAEDLKECLLQGLSFCGDYKRSKNS